MNLSIIDTGYVGLTTGTCFAEVGHHVTCVDNDPEKIGTLLAGEIPIYEPGLEDLVKKNVAAGRLKFTTSTAEGVRDGEVVFIAVPTPPQPDGSVDLCFIEKVAREIARRESRRNRPPLRARGRRIRRHLEPRVPPRRQRRAGPARARPHRHRLRRRPRARADAQDL
jgi:hypothetical protein